MRADLFPAVSGANTNKRQVTTTATAVTPTRNTGGASAIQNSVIQAASAKMAAQKKAPVRNAQSQTGGTKKTAVRARKKTGAQLMDNYRPIGEMLVESGYCKDKHIQYALNIQKMSKDKIGAVLVSMGLVTEVEFMKTLALQLGLQYIEENMLFPERELLKKVSKKKCLSLGVLPLKEEQGHVLVATCKVPSPRLSQALRSALGKSVVFGIACESAIHFALYKNYSGLEVSTLDLMLREARSLKSDVNQAKSPEKFLEYLLLYAVQMRATDVHIQPNACGITIAIRVDGILQTITCLHAELSRLIASVKLMARMDISEKRLPQDGRFARKILACEFDIRVSSIVTPNGEDLVLRLLPKIQANFSLTSLGFLDDDVNKVREVFNEPSGIVILTGPTGAGKSTTMIAGLLSLDLLEKNVLTIENPIEYVVPLAKQTQVLVEAGYDFSDGMRHFLRHDPDVILIGEMRDEQTAKTAMTAALTGHLVLSTLHSNSVFGVISD